MDQRGLQCIATGLETVVEVKQNWSTVEMATDFE